MTPNFPMPPRAIEPGHICVVLGLLFLFCLIAPAGAQEGLPYEAVIEGIDERSFRMDLESALTTFELQARPPPTVNLLRYRAEEDLPLIVKALRARGYYAATAAVDLEEAARPLLVTFRVEQGPLFVFSAVDIILVDTDAAKQEIKLPAADQLGLKEGDPARARAILEAEEKLRARIAAEGFPFSRVVDRRVVVDHATRQVAVTFEVQPGPFAHFGATELTGLESVAGDFILRMVPWQKRQAFDGDLLSRFQQKLIETGLFAIVRVTHGEQLDEDGLLPIAVELTERKQRTVKAGLRYSTDEGIGGRFSWEHRNLFRYGERLTLGVETSQIALALQGRFNKPYFFSDRQTLDATFRMARDDTEVYTSNNLDSAVMVDRQLTEEVLFGAGLGFRQARVTQLDQADEYSLLYLPARLEWNSTDSLLDPTRGSKFAVRVAPYYDVVQTDLGFFKASFNTSHYYELVEKPYVLFAVRAGMGTISGQSAADIPADLRFYAGGGGSIRGYPYQKVGPTQDGDPIGGRSILELSAEFRFKVTETIGVVAFVDGGNAYENSYPDLSEPIRWGAGAGLRYYTAFGPLRLDVGFPINPPSNVNDWFQIYLSIGQAF